MSAFTQSTAPTGADEYTYEEVIDLRAGTLVRDRDGGLYAVLEGMGGEDNRRLVYFTSFEQTNGGEYMDDGMFLVPESLGDAFAPYNLAGKGHLVTITQTDGTDRTSDSYARSALTSVLKSLEERISE